MVGTLYGPKPLHSTFRDDRSAQSWMSRASPTCVAVAAESGPSRGARRVLELARSGGGRGVLPLVPPGGGGRLPTPPQPVADLAVALAQADDPSSCLRRGRFLGGAEAPLPRDPAAPRCSLLLREEGSRRWRDNAVSSFFGDLFKAVAEREALALDRFDLFHAHLIVLHGPGRLGALFHAREYPAGVHEGGHFPFDLGFCHAGSTCLDASTDPVSAATSMARRNLLWLLAGDEGRGQQVFVLDTSLDGLACDLEGGCPGSPPAPRELVRDYHLPAHTILESDLGECPADVYFFQGEVRVCTRP